MTAMIVPHIVSWYCIAGTRLCRDEETRATKSLQEDTCYSNFVCVLRRNGISVPVAFSSPIQSWICWCRPYSIIWKSHQPCTTVDVKVTDRHKFELRVSNSATAMAAPPSTGLRSSAMTTSAAYTNLVGSNIREGKFTETIYQMIRDNRFNEAIQTLNTTLLEFPNIFFYKPRFKRGFSSIAFVIYEWASLKMQKIIK